MFREIEIFVEQATHHYSLLDMVLINILFEENSPKKI